MCRTLYSLVQQYATAVRSLPQDTECCVRLCSGPCFTHSSSSCGRGNPKERRRRRRVCGKWTSRGRVVHEILRASSGDLISEFRSTAVHYIQHSTGGWRVRPELGFFKIAGTIGGRENDRGGLRANRRHTILTANHHNKRKRKQAPTATTDLQRRPQVEPAIAQQHPSSIPLSTRKQK